MLSESYLVQNSRKGYIYTVLAPEMARVKIGFSVDPEKRLKGLQTGSSEHLIMVGYWEGWEFQEKQIHELFDEEWEKLEWFKISKRLALFIEKHTSVNIFSLMEVKSLDDLKRHASTVNGKVPSLPEWILQQGKEMVTGDDFQFRYLLDIPSARLAGRIRSLKNLYEFEIDSVTVALGQNAKGKILEQVRARYPLYIWIAAAYFCLTEAGLKVNAVRLLLDESFREKDIIREDSPLAPPDEN